MTSILVTAFITFLVSTSAYSWENDKAVIVEKVAADLFSATNVGLGNSATRPKVIIAGVQNQMVELSSKEMSSIVDLYEEKLHSRFVVLDRSNLGSTNAEQVFQQSGAVSDSMITALGSKYGAEQAIFIKFSDSVVKVDSGVNQTTLTAKIQVIDVATSRKLLVKNIVTKYESEIYVDNNILTDGLGYTFGLAAVVGVGGGLYYDIQADRAKEKYDKATTADDAKKYKTVAKSETDASQLSWGVGLLAAGASYYFLSGTDESWMRYQLISDGRIIGVNFAWEVP